MKNILLLALAVFFSCKNSQVSTVGEFSIEAIAKKAMERKTGARGLRSIMEAVLLDTMYRIPSEEGVTKVVVDGTVINGDSEPLLVYETAAEPEVAEVPVEQKQVSKKD